MNTKSKFLQTWSLYGLALALLRPSLPSVTAADSNFTDANWSSMNPIIPGADGVVVYAAVVDGSGNLYVAGDFTVIGELIVNSIAKWDGKVWSRLGAGLGVPADYYTGPRVHALAVSGNDLYVAGEFTSAGGLATTNIAKWNGSNWSALGSGIDGEVSALAVSGSDLYAGGYFTTAGGSAANCIAKWDGSSWSSLHEGVGSGSSSGDVVRSLAASGSDLYAGGNFKTMGGNAIRNIAKWNGSNWTALGSGLGNPGLVYALATSGSDLYVGGEFTMAGGIAASNIAKWNGSSWSALGGGMSDLNTPFVNAFTVSGGDLYAGGHFHRVGGIPANNIARWNGSGWSVLGSGIGGDGCCQPVFTLAMLGNEVFAGGQFTTAGGTAANSMTRWNGSSWSALVAGSGMNGNVMALTTAGNDVYAGGNFTTAGGAAVNYIAKWKGSCWSALGSGMNDAVYALAALGSDVYAAGAFTNAGGTAANHIARWNGTNWSALGLGITGGFNGQPPAVNALAVSGSNLYVAGSFSNAGGIATSNIAKWNGSSWSALGSGIVRESDGLAFFVSALAVSGDGVYVGGRFRTAGGIAATYIAKWDGSSWSALGPGLSGFHNVLSLAVVGTDLYVSRESGILNKWNGSSWSELESRPGNGGGGGVGYALAASGGDLYVGVRSLSGDGDRAGSIAKWNGSSWSALGSGLDGFSPFVFALAVSGNDLYAGGAFATAGGKVSGYIARAYLGALPTLSVDRSRTDVKVSWPSVDTAGFALEQTGTLSLPPSWVANTASITDDGTNKSVTLPARNSAEFFRLRRP